MTSHSIINNKIPSKMTPDRLNLMDPDRNDVLYQTPLFHCRVTHLPHQQPSPIAASTPLTTPNSSPPSTQVLSLETLPAASPICSTYFSQPFANYSIITPPTSPKPINPLVLLPLLESPLKSSVLSLLAALWNAPTSHHT